MKVLFLVTELYEPVGGLHRYTTNLLSEWDKVLEKNETDLEPVVVSVKSPSKPLKDLAQSRRCSNFIEENSHVNVYEAERGGERCYFLGGEVPDLEEFHWRLWDRYGIDSSDTSKHMDWYNDTLSVFWYWVPKFAEFLSKEAGMEFKCIDAQDWLAFPAGFLTRDKLDLPLVCRFHSGEFGRSLGNPNMDAAPIQIETSALQFSDYIQGVSVSESIFQITKLMSLKKNSDMELKKRKGEKWYDYQKMRDDRIRRFLLYEPNGDLTLLREMVGGMPNGINLGDWDGITEEDIRDARSEMEDRLPDKDRFMFFIGRTDRRKGLDFLLEACARYRHDPEEMGIVIASSMNEQQYQNYTDILKERGIRDDTYILDKWLDPEEKRSLMCASDVIALPSLYEPFGIVALEGLAADYAAERNGMTGPVVVVGNTGGMDEIIKSGTNGFEVPIHNYEIDPGMLQEALHEALKDSIKGKISQEGARRVKSKHFRWENIFKKILQVYDRAQENYEEREKFFRED